MKLPEWFDYYLCDYQGRFFLFSWFHDFNCWFKDHFIAPWNRLHIKTLSCRYHDKDEILLHAAFQLLVNYVENECDNEWFSLDKPFDIEEELKTTYSKEWCDDEMRQKVTLQLEEQNRIQKEIKDLYIWWTINRPFIIEQERKRLELIDYEGILESDEKQEKEDDEMLLRLIKVRKSLWT